MYGKRRAILKPNAKQTIVVAGNKSCHPIGYWYKHDGKFYADLRSPDQLCSAVNRGNVGMRGIGGVSSKKELRDKILSYYDQTRKEIE